MISARNVIYTILYEAIYHRSYINLQLKSLSHNEMPFISACVYGVIQHYRQCRVLYEPYTTRKVSAEVDIILMMSAYQAHYMHDIPSYAIKAEAMKLCDQHAPYAKGFVTAVCEKMFKATLFKASDQESIDEVSLETSFQPWIIAMWKSHYGMDFATKFAHFSNQPSPLFGFMHYQDLSRMSHVGEPLTDFGFKTDKTLLKHPYFSQGRAFIADIHAQRVGFEAPIKPNEKVLDACGAPGGKSIMMAMKTHDQAHIVCADVSLHRLRLVEKAITNAQLRHVTTHQMDARFAHEHFASESFDGVLVDAPCSGLGVLRRKPEIKMFIKPEDIDELTQIQAQILQSCSMCLKVGGWLVYSTCTLNKKENEKQIEFFLKNNNNFVLEHVTPFDCFTIGGDGFFMATLRKIQ